MSARKLVVVAVSKPPPTGPTATPTSGQTMAVSSRPSLFGNGSRVGVKTLYIEPGSPWENGYNESFNGKLKDELLDREIFYTLREAQVLIEQWRRHYNTVRPHSSLGYRPPAPQTMRPTAIKPWHDQRSSNGPISLN